MNDELITLSEIAAGGVSALNRLRLLIDRTQRAATPMNDAWVSLTAEIERALVDQSRYQDTLMRDVQTSLSLLAKRTEECESLRAQLSEAQAALKDPIKVFVNMQRGIIAKPPFRGFLDLYGEVFNDIDSANVALAEVRWQFSEAQARLAEIEAQRPKAWVHGRHEDGRPYIVCREDLEVGTELYAAPAAPAAQADTRAAAVERAAKLAGRVAGEETANTIRHAGIVIGTNNECPTCKRY